MEVSKNEKVDMFFIGIYGDGIAYSLRRQLRCRQQNGRDR